MVTMGDPAAAAATFDQAPVRVGDVVAGKYRVERVLGAGGMGCVVAARHVELEQRVALKLLRPDAGDVASASRLLLEAKAAVKLRGEHVARVFDVGRMPDGAPFLVMEYLEGRDLGAVVAAGGPLAPGLAALYMRQVCEGVAEAHAAGIIHRDLKPQNLFLTQRLDGSPCVKVLDFGISKMRGTEHAKLTAADMIVGSPAYMAPEQMTGREVDARSDVWALGASLYEICTGRCPYAEPTVAEQYAQIVAGPPPPPSRWVPGFPEELSRVILRCLARQPSERYASVVELGRALDACAQGGAPFLAIDDAQVVTRALPREPARASRAWIAAAVAFAVVAAVAALAVLALHRAEPEPIHAVPIAASSPPPPTETAAPSSAGIPVAALPLASASSKPPPSAKPKPSAHTTAAPSSDPYQHRTW
jgi:serine/threonine-protein kinase